jgi:hypothetical protein
MVRAREGEEEGERERERDVCGHDDDFGERGAVQEASTRRAEPQEHRAFLAPFHTATKKRRRKTAATLKIELNNQIFK